MIVRTSVIVLSSLAIYFSSLSVPEIGYDMIGYIASAYEEDGYSGVELNNKTVADIKVSIPEKKFQDFRDGSEFWNTVLGDPKSLHQIVPLYAMRIIYIELMRFVHSLGFSYTAASIQVSALFGGLSVLALALIIMKVNLSIVILPILIMVTNLLGVAQSLSPDSLACFFGLLAIYLLIVDSSIIYFIAVLIPLARTDLILLSGLMMFYLFFNGHNKLAVLAASFFSIVALVAANKLHGNYGLLNLFNNHHIHRTQYPADIPISSNPRDYILPYVRLIRDALGNSQSVIYLIAISIFMYSKKMSYEIKYEYPLFIIPFVYVLLHVMLFPTYFERYFIFSVLLILIGTMHFLKYQLLRPSETKGGY